MIERSLRGFALDMERDIPIPINFLIGKRHNKIGSLFMGVVVVAQGEKLSRRVLITGSRKWFKDSIIHQVLDKEMAENPDGLIIVHGTASGADSIADLWAKERKQQGYPVQVERHPAKWNSFGHMAGLMRNCDMVALGADVCHAFPYGKANGTRHCMEIAERAGIPVISHEGDE